MNKQLSARERAFAAQYVVRRNAKAAAIAASVSAKNAKVQGHRMLHRPRVRAEIARLNELAIANAAEVAGAKQSPQLDGAMTVDPSIAAATAILTRAAHGARLIELAEIVSGKRATRQTIMPGKEGGQPVTGYVRNADIRAMLMVANLIGKELDFQEALQRNAAAKGKGAAIAKRHHREAMDKWNGLRPVGNEAVATAAGNVARSPQSKASATAEGNVAPSVRVKSAPDGKSNPAPSAHGDSLTTAKGKAVRSAQPNSEPADNGNAAPSAPISLMITKAQKAALLAKGYKEEEVRQMTPGEAHQILNLLS